MNLTDEERTVRAIQEGEGEVGDRGQTRQQWHSPRTVHSFLRLRRSGVPFKGFPLRVSIIRPIPNCAMPELLPVQGSRTLNSATEKNACSSISLTSWLSLSLSYETARVHLLIVALE